MFKQWKITIPQLTGDEARNAYIYVPDFAVHDPKVRLPVLYMFDGHNLFFDEEATYGRSWGLLEYMEQTETPLIIAAAECNHDPRGGRLREYCPFTAEMPGFGRIRGRGRTTMEWLVGEFKPYIDRHYRTLPDWEHTFIGGSSMGGLMSLYAITQYNKVFSRCAALSPSLWFGEEKVERMLTTHRIRRGTVVYMDYGERELGHRKLAERVGQAAAALMGKGALVNARIVPDGDHNEASWERQIPFFMQTLLYGLDIVD